MTGGYTYMLLRSVVALGLVIALMAGVLYAFRRLYGVRGASLDAMPISILSKAFLGQKSSIAIVEVAGEVLVLGVSPNAVNLLMRLEDSEIIKKLKATPGRRGGLEKLFDRLNMRALLVKGLNKGSGGGGI